MTIRFPGTFTDQYPYDLAAALRRYRVYDPDYGLYKDPEIYEKLAKDAAIFDADDTHNNMVAGSDWFFEAASDRPQDKQAAQFMEVCFKRIKSFTQVRKQLAGARLMGSVWGVVEHEKTRVRLPWEERHREVRVISGVVHKDKRNLRLLEDRAPDSKTGWKWEVHQGQREGARTNATIGNWVDVDSRYVRHSYADVEKSLGYGRGVVEAVYTLWWIKAAALEHGLDWLERWARGEIVVNTDLTIEAEKNVTSSTRMVNLLAAIQKIRKGGGIVLPKGDDAKILEPSGTGYEAALKMVAYCDSEIRRLLLGADMPGGASPGGAFASDVVKENSIELKVLFGRSLLEEMIDRTMAKRVWVWNTITRFDLGLSHAEPPVFRLRKEKRESPKERLEILEGGARLGILARRDEAASQLGITLPAEGDETIKAPATTTQGQGIPAQFMPQPGEEPRAPVGQADEQGTVAAPEGNQHTLTIRHVYAAGFDESKHPRGQPGNPGQFGPGGGRVAPKADTPATNVEGVKSKGVGIAEGDASYVVRGELQFPIDRDYSPPGSVFRGVTSEEAQSISVKGEIKSTGAFSHSSEGTSFGESLAESESYANVGRDNPLKTKKPTFVLEVSRGPEHVVDPRDGYIKASVAIPATRVLRVWRFDPSGKVSVHPSVDDAINS